MKISKFYLIGVIFVFVGLCIKIPSWYFEANDLFQVGLCFSGVGIIFLVISVIKNKRRITPDLFHV